MSTDTHTHTQSIKIALLNWPSWPCRCRNNVRVCVCACVEGGRVRRCDHSQHSVKSYHRLQPVIMSSSNHCVCVCVCPSEVLQNSHYFGTRVTPAKRDYIRDQTQDTPMNIDLFFLLFLSLLSRWWIDTIRRLHLHLQATAKSDDLQGGYVEICHVLASAAAACSQSMTSTAELMLLVLTCENPTGVKLDSASSLALFEQT